jgi:O-antigen ligase
VALAGGGLGLALLPALPARLGPLRLPTAAVSAAALAAGVASSLPSLSLVGAYSRYESAPMRLAYLGLFCLAAACLEGPRDRRRAVTWFLAGCAVASLEALWQLAAGTGFRPDGNLGQPNLLGALLAMALPLAAGRALGDRRWLLPAALLAAGLLASASRSGWLGALAGLAAAGALEAGARWGRRGTLAALGAGFAGLAVAAGLLLLTPLRDLNGDTGSARLHVWRDSASLIAARPIAGWGEDTLGIVFGPYLTGDWQPGATFDRVHSAPLDLAAAQGLAGLGAGTWFWGVFAWRVLRRREAGEAAALAGACAAYGAWGLLNFDWAPATAPFWLLAGTLWSEVAPPVAARPRRRRPWALGAALAAWAAATVLLAAAPLAADLAWYAGSPAWAARIDPLQPRYHRALGEKLGGAAGLAELRLAARLGESDPAFWLELGDAERRAGNPRAAGAAYGQGRRIAPYDAALRQAAAAAAANSPGPAYSSSS